MSAERTAICSTICSSFFAAIVATIESTVGSAIWSTLGTAVYCAIWSTHGTAVKSSDWTAVEAAFVRAIKSTIKPTDFRSIDSNVTAILSSILSAVCAPVGAAFLPAVKSAFEHNAIWAAFQSTIKAAIQSPVCTTFKSTLGAADPADRSTDFTANDSYWSAQYAPVRALALADQKPDANTHLPTVISAYTVADPLSYGTPHEETDRRPFALADPHTYGKPHEETDRQPFALADQKPDANTHLPTVVSAYTVADQGANTFSNISSDRPTYISAEQFSPEWDAFWPAHRTSDDSTNCPAIQCTHKSTFNAADFIANRTIGAADSVSIKPTICPAIKATNTTTKLGSVRSTLVSTFFQGISTTIGLPNCLSVHSAVCLSKFETNSPKRDAIWTAIEPAIIFTAVQPTVWTTNWLPIFTAHTTDVTTKQLISIFCASVFEADIAAE